MKPQFGLLALITFVATVSMPVSLMTQEGMSRLKFPASFSTSKVLAQTTEARKAEADRLFQQGIEQRRASQFQETIQSMQQALTIYREIGDRQGEADSLRNLGNAYNSLGQYHNTIELYQQSLVIAREVGNRESEISSLNNLGFVYTYLQQHQKAIDFFYQSLAINKEIKDRQGEANSLINLGARYSLIGQYEKAVEFYQRHLTITRKIGDRQGEASSLNNLGDAYNSLGQNQKAIEFLQQSLVIAREIGDRQGEAASMLNLGSAYNSLGQYQKALEFFQQSTVIFREIGNWQAEASCLKNLGDFYSSFGQYQKSIEFYQQSLTIFGEQAGSLSGLGDVYSSLGQYQKAIEFYQQSLAIARRIGDNRGEADSLLGFGLVYSSLGQYQKAIALLEQSLAITREIKYKKTEVYSLMNLASIYNSFGQHQKTNEIFESLRFLKLSNADRLNVFEIKAKNAHFLQRTLIAQNKTNTALEIAERGRARAFVELLASRLSPQSDSQLTIAPPNALQLQQIAAAHNATLIQYSIIQDPIQVQGKQEWRESRLFTWVIPPSGRIIFRWTDLKPLLKNTSLYNVVSNSTSIAPINPDSSTVVTTSPELEPKLLTSWHNSGVIILLSLSGISLISLAVWCGRFFLTKKAVQPHKTQRRWLAPSVFLVLAISSSGGLVFLINQTQSIVQNPSPRNDSLLAEFVSNTRASVSNRETIFQKLLRGLGIVPKEQHTSQSDQLQQLHQILIDPIADLLPTDPNSPVIFIPQNSLFLVPFPALKDKDGKYLIEKHTILTAPSIQTLDLTHQQKLRNRELGNNGEALIVGNPTMPSVPPQIGEPPQQLPSLPGAEQEAKAIAKLLNTQAITGNQATKSAILEKMSSARIIHLATHGILDEYRGLGSAIALAPNPNYPDKIGEVNGLLTAEEILDLKLNASLVVLSACDTGRGRITGDGVVGLSRSLISAGVPSVLVSLWSVPDAPTAELMTEFYRNWQHNPDKAQALRQAMLTTMKQHPNPRDWAAFTLIGEAN